MAFEMEMPESPDIGGSFLQEPGTYHLAVLNVDEQPTSKSGQLIDGFRVDLEVLAGPQAKKQAEVTFWNPKLTDKNNGEMAKKKQYRFAFATGLLDGFKPGAKVSIDLQKAKGRQLIATLAQRESQNDPSKKFIDLNFADIWHVDDPAAPNCERNQDALKLLPKQLRRDPASFKPASAAPAANGNGTPKPPALPQQQVAAGTATGVSFDDI